MLKKSLLMLIAVIFLLSLALNGCDPRVTTTPPSTVVPRGNTGTFATGKSVEAAKSTVSAAGGMITVSKPGTPVDGLTLEVPAGAYAAPVDFSISYATIEKQSFGADCNPITPMITVDGAEELSAEIMKITVPVAVPEEQFAMGFIYDAETKTLSGMSTVAQDENSITIATRHFCAFFISTVDKETLKKDIDSGFRPGIDDWQFDNLGSYLEPGGHCAGQAVTAIWYYVTQPDGEGYALYGRYDNNGEEPATPDLQYDDALGYRFASVVHHDIDWTTWENKFWADMAGVNDALTFNLFAYAMRLTGEPQETGIYSKAGGGHDMVCYRIYKNELYIADPNYHGNLDRRIPFSSSNMTFSPYNSGANAEEIAKGKGKNYEIIQFCPKNATINWKKIAARWNELKGGTIGDTQFPDYKLVYKDDKGNLHDLADGFVSASPKLVMGAMSTDGKTAIGSALYRDGVVMPGSVKSEADLQPGNNKIGVYVVVPVTRTDAKGKKYIVNKFVDFTYVNVVYSALTIDPEEVMGEPGETITFTATGGYAPPGAEYEWIVESEVLQKSPDNSISITFHEEGSYILIAIVHDINGDPLAMATASVFIIGGATQTPVTTPPPAFDIAGMEIRIDAWGWYSTDWHDTDESTSGLFRDSEDERRVSLDASFSELAWNGSSFQGTDDDGRYVIRGNISAGNLLTFTVTDTYINTEMGVTRNDFIITVTGVPYNDEYSEWRVEGASLQSYLQVTEFFESSMNTTELLYLVWDKAGGAQDYFLQAYPLFDW